MSAHDEEKKGGFKVVDNRRFDSDGNEKGSAPKKEALREPSPSHNGAASNANSSPQRGDEAPPFSGEIDFSSFVISLGTQALMQLGVMPPPEGVSMAVDKVAAKQTIDILQMLSEKTKGNLEEGEKKLIEEILHSCRISFVRAGK